MFDVWRKKSLVSVRVGLLVGLWLALCPMALPARDKSAIADFISFSRTGPSSAVMQTSVTRFRHPQTNQVVSLVGAVHIGENSYYRAIQAELDRHDLVLYELVGGPAPGSVEALEQGLQEGDDFSSKLGERQIFRFIQVIQQQMQEMLQLQHQKDGIDYTRKNFRHADLDAVEFAAALAEKGLFNIDPSALLSGIGPAMLDGIGLQAALTSQDANTVNRVRWILGQMMAKSISQLAILGVADIERPQDLILGMRNDEAWKILGSSLEEGWRRTAIFYGAAHLPDLRRRLLEEGWIFEAIEWIPAWKIPAIDSDNEPLPISLEARL
jgi:hypothetical protein